MTDTVHKWLWPAIIVAMFIGIMFNGMAHAQQQPQNTPQQADELRDPVDLQPGETINVNTATVEMLERIPSIGPAIAKAIVDWRTQKCANQDPCVAFSKVEDLDEVPNIGPRRLEQLARYVTTEEVTQQPKQPQRRQ